MIEGTKKNIATYLRYGTYQPVVGVFTHHSFLPTLIPLGYQVLDIYNGKVLINHNILISCKVG